MPRAGRSPAVTDAPTDGAPAAHGGLLPLVGRRHGGRAHPGAHPLLAGARRTICVGAWIWAAGCGLADEAARLAGDPALGRATGVGTSAAIEVAGRAAAVAERLGTTRRAACGPPLPSGPVTVSTTVLYVGKGRGRTDRWTRTSVWRRDAAGNVALEERIAFVLPDGRHTTRSTERRSVDGERYAAIDGRFARADRVPDFDDELATAALAPVDGLLAAVARDPQTGALVAAVDAPLCGRFPAQDLPPVAAASFTLAPLRRAGWLDWRDTDRSLVVTFDERVTAGAAEVAAPDRVWPVDPDPWFDHASRVLDALHAAGWLQTDGSGEPVGTGVAADDPSR